MSAPRRYLGLDLGGTKIAALVLGDDLRIVADSTLPTPRDEGPEAVLARCAEMATALAARAGPLHGVGLGFAGLVDPSHGVVRSSVILPDFDGLPVAARLRAALDLPVTLDNDATAAGYGEWVALGSPAALDLVLLTVGTGVGGALVLGGRVHRGATGTAGEICHTTLDWKGERCACGSWGCVNGLASGPSIAARATRRAPGEPAPPLEEVAGLARSGDERALAAIAEGAEALGAAVANLVNLLAPDRVSLCGGVLGLGDDYLERVRDSARRRSLREPFEHVVIERARHGARAGAFGAACLARDAAPL
ncbi:MAG: ROK family protein [Planctomycetes bacterium]|nr:ROK family protein [Planctomycetota bacterium]